MAKETEEKTGPVESEKNYFYPSEAEAEVEGRTKIFHRAIAWRENTVKEKDGMVSNFKLIEYKKARSIITPAQAALLNYGVMNEMGNKTVTLYLKPGTSKIPPFKHGN